MLKTGDESSLRTMRSRIERLPTGVRGRLLGLALDTEKNLATLREHMDRAHQDILRYRHDFDAAVSRYEGSNRH
ncbi:MAG: hypothetical protein ACE5F9_07060 [Phycisphaerae bacterium]